MQWMQDTRAPALCRELSLEALQRSGFRDPVLVAAGDTQAETLAVRHLAAPLLLSVLRRHVRHATGFM
jgi:hypothetical protein